MYWLLTKHFGFLDWKNSGLNKKLEIYSLRKIIILTFWLDGITSYI